MNPDFERLRKVLLLEGKPDRVPLVELIVDNIVKEAFLGKKILSMKEEVEFWFKAGYDYVSLCPPYDFKIKYQSSKEKTSVYDGELRERNWAIEKNGIIQNLDDFEKHLWQKIEEVNFSCFEEANKFLHSNVKIIARAGDIFTHVWEFMGFENFSYALNENKELVEKLFEKIGSFIYKIFEKEVKLENIGALWYSDDIAYTEGLLVDPKILQKYLFPWMERIGNLAKKHNLPYLYHSDGKLWQVMDDLISVGINALHPIEPKGMDSIELKAKYGNKLCLIGNIEVDRLARGTPDEIKELVKNRIKTLAIDGGYCVGSSNTVPEYVPLANYKAMIEATFQYGKY